MLKRLLATAVAVMLAAAFAAPVARAETAPDAMVRQISADVIGSARSDPTFQTGDTAKLLELVNAKLMPAVNFEVVTRSAVGPKWREATADQRQKLQNEFKTLLVSFYAGGLRSVKEYEVQVTETVAVPGRSDQVVVRTKAAGKTDSHMLDYRLDKSTGDWKIIDLAVDGIWVTLSYRAQFAEDLAKGGINGLIASLVERNKTGTKS